MIRNNPSNTNAFGNPVKEEKKTRRELIKHYGDNCNEENHSEKISAKRNLCRVQGHALQQIATKRRGRDSRTCIRCKRCDYVETIQPYGYPYNGFLHKECLEESST